MTAARRMENRFRRIATAGSGSQTSPKSNPPTSVAPCRSQDQATPKGATPCAPSIKPMATSAAAAHSRCGPTCSCLARSNNSKATPSAMQAPVNSRNSCRRSCTCCVSPRSRCEDRLTSHGNTPASNTAARMLNFEGALFTGRSQSWGSRVSATGITVTPSSESLKEANRYETPLR